MRRAQWIGAAALAMLCAANGAAAQSPKTLDIVKQRGALICAVNTGSAGYAQRDDKGTWSGFDVSYCRAIAAAVLGDPTKVNFRPTTAKERFSVLQSGEADILVRQTTWTLGRESSGLAFAATNYYDGQGFMVRKTLGVKSAKELEGSTICVATGTTTELNLADYFRANKMTYKSVVYENAADVNAAYDSGRCDAYTTDASGLYSVRVALKNPDEHVVLPEIISKEPLALVVRQGDDQWLNIAKWVHFALVNAEELGVTQANVDELKKTSINPDAKRLLGAEGDFGKGLGLANDWVVNIIKAIGNYGENFEANLGQGSRLKIDRGLNRLWSQGGIQYAPPIR